MNWAGDPSRTPVRVDFQVEDGSWRRIRSRLGAACEGRLESLTAPRVASRGPFCPSKLLSPTAIPTSGEPRLTLSSSANLRTSSYDRTTSA